MRTGGQLLVACLRALGGRHLFGVPGESYLSILDGLYDHEDMRFINARQEGGAAMMAAAYGKLTGRPGLCCVTRGPGATNASIGIHVASQDSSPMLVLIGQVESSHRGREAFQEIEYERMFAPLAKWVAEVRDADRIPEFVARGWRTACSGRPGPVVLVLPEDVGEARTAVLPCQMVQIPRPAPDPQACAEAHRLLTQATRPVVLLGGSLWDETARAHLRAFLEAWHLPVLVSFRSQDLLEQAHPGYVGDTGVTMTPATAEILRSADTILALGARIDEAAVAGYTLMAAPDPEQTLIHVHPCAETLGKVYNPMLPIQAHPGLFCAAMQAPPAQHTRWRTTARESYARTRARHPKPASTTPLDMEAVMQTLAQRLPEDAILTNGAGNFALWPSQRFPYGSGQRLLAPKSGAMGYGLPAALAAKVVHPERCVVCFTGDGDFQMTLQELGCAQQEGLNPVVLVLNNGTYGTIQMHQERRYPGRPLGTALHNPDFPALARAYGFHSARIQRTEDFAPALDEALASPTGAVLDLALEGVF